VDRTRSIDMNCGNKRGTKRRVSIVNLINYRAESGTRLGRVKASDKAAFFHVCMIISKVVNGKFSECEIDRSLLNFLLNGRKIAA
jgi:hypothetical protein